MRVWRKKKSPSIDVEANSNGNQTATNVTTSDGSELQAPEVARPSQVLLKNEPASSVNVEANRNGNEAMPNITPSNASQLQPLEIERPSPPRRFMSNAFQYIRSALLAAGGLSLLLVLVCAVETPFLLFNYFSMYADVYPGSMVAQHLSGGGGTAFYFFMYLICGCTLSCTCPGGVYLIGTGIQGVSEISQSLACLIALPWAAICLFLGTWQIWISWAVEPSWWNVVYNGACRDWSGYVLLQGVSFQDVQLDSPMLGTATVVLPYGNYTMELDRKSQNVYSFYTIGQNNVNSYYQEIQYNTFNHTIRVDNTTMKWVLSPNLAFPSLNLTLDNPSIPFSNGQCDLPSANLVYNDGSYVLNTVNQNYDDCTILKTCVNMEYQKEFEIAMGVVLLYQGYYGVCCTTPSDNSDS
jgi:hypothetical protein